MPLSQAQTKIAYDTNRFRVAICGRRFGKTFLSMRELAKFAREPNRRVWYVAPTYRQAKQTVWAQLKEKLRRQRWIKKVNESDLTITLINDSEISLRSGDNPDSLRGVGLDFIVLDEFADLQPEVWHEVLRPTLSDKNGHALFIGTPKGVGNWAKDIFDMHLTRQNWSSYQFTTLDGGNVSADEIDQAKQDLDERTFRQEYLATFETFSGRVFYNFDSLNIQPFAQDTPPLIYLGMDFNIDPMSIVLAHREGEVLHIFDEIRIFGSNTQEAIDELRSRYPSQRVVAYPDPAGHQRKTSAGGRTDITILQNAGFRVVAPHKHNPVRDGINAVNARLLNSNGERRLLVDARCKYTIEALERLVYKPGTTQPDKESGYDHMADALRYLVDGLWPIKRELEDDPYKPMTWGHQLG